MPEDHYEGDAERVGRVLEGAEDCSVDDVPGRAHHRRVDEAEVKDGLGGGNRGNRR